MHKYRNKLVFTVFSLIVITALTIPLITSAATLINDTFADGSSQNQDLANNSLQLFNGRAANVRTDAVGSVNFNLMSGSSEGFWAYFTDPNAPITLGVGDSLAVSAQFSLQGLTARAGEDLRFGVFDSKGTRNTTNLTGGMNSSTFTDDTGYAGRLAGTTGGDTPFSIFRRAVVPGASDPLSQAVSGNSGEYTEIAGSTTTGRQPLTDNTPYTYTYKIERLTATDTRLTVTIVGGAVNIQTTATETSSNPNTTFDLFSFRIPGTSFASQITFTQLKVDYSPAAPVITSQPQPSNQTVQVGSNVSYSVSATGSNLSYQWRKDGTPITGNPSAMTATLQLTNVQTGDTGNYDVVVSNAGGSVTSNSVSLTVTTGQVDPAPVITSQPQDTFVTIGSTATLSVTAMGNNLFYQWYKDGSPLSGENSSTITITNAQLSDTGNYTVVVSNSGGSLTSSPARLTVVSPISVTAMQPINGAMSVCVDTALKLTFDQVPQAGTRGIIRVYNADGTIFDSIDLSQDTVPGANVPGNQSSKSIGGASTMFNYYPIIVTDNTAAIYLHKQLDYNQTYYITIETGAITDANGAPFVGISDPNAFRFTTKAGAPALGTQNLTVAADGSGDFCTVQGAVDFVPANNNQRFTINVQSGVYTEIVYINSSKPYITVRGEDRNATIIQYANNENLNSGTLARTLFGVDAADFVLETITIHNTTTRENAQGDTRQAEAFRGNNDRILLNRVNLISFQDTLMLQSQGAQGAFVNDSYIEGAVDFTWGYGAVYFRNCELKDNASATRSTSYYSQIRNPQGKNGNVYVGCRLTRAADTPDNTAYLSRIDPDDFPYSQVIYIDTLMDTHIRPEGWLFNNPSLPPTPENYPNIQFYEYNSRNINTGQPVDVSQRHPLSRQLTAEEAAFYRNPANVLGGWLPSFEGDVYPRNQRDAVINISDFTQIGRFVAGLDTPTDADEFQRADIAPYATAGDSQLNISDFIQAGRYAANLDPMQAERGAIQQTSSPSSDKSFSPTREMRAGKNSLNVAAASRDMTIVSQNVSPGQQVTVPVTIESQGDENGFGFSIDYDTTKISNPTVQLGADTQGGLLIPNTTNAGEVGVALVLQPGQTLTAGTRQLVTITFDVAADAPAGSTPLTFGNIPVASVTADQFAAPLPVNYINGSINIQGPTAAAVIVGGRVITNGRGVSGAGVFITNSVGNTRYTRTNPFGFFRFDDVSAGNNYILTIQHKRYVFPVRSLNVTENLTDLTITNSNSVENVRQALSKSNLRK